MKKEKLRISVVVDNVKLLNWQYSIIKTLQDETYAEIKLFLFLDTENPARKNSKTKRRLSTILKLHLLLDKFLFGQKTHFNKFQNIEHLLSDRKSESSKIINIANTGKVDSGIIKQIQNCKLDVILQFSKTKLPDIICSIPKYGVWKQKHINVTASDEVPTGYWEVIKRKNKIVTYLTVSDVNSYDDCVLYKFSILPDYISISKSQNALFGRLSSIILHILSNLYHNGEDYFKGLLQRFNEEDKLLNSTKSHIITPADISRNLLAYIIYFFTRIWRKLFYRQHWFILYKQISSSPSYTSLKEYKTLQQPKDRIWADPFIISHINRHYIFVEEHLHKHSRGHIAVIEIDNEGNVKNYVKVLERNYHLSYPFLFKYENTYYMIPETGANKTIELYRCLEFPYKWTFVKNLMSDILSADVTLFFHNSKWWLFCCVDRTGRDIGIMDELHLYYSDHLFSNKWNSHPCNPINTDVSSSRPAGNIFIQDNKIYRPSQDCSGMYGKAINLNQILVLTETEYNETLISRITPDPEIGVTGTHTINFSKNFVVVDGFNFIKK